MNRSELAGRAVKYVQKYKYVLLLLLVGVILLLWPTGKAVETGETPAPEADWFRTAELEERLEAALSQIEGAGKVTVVLTLREAPRQVMAQDGKASEGNGQQSRETSTVLVSRGSGVQETVPLTQVGPSYQGALVVAAGAGDPRVRLALSDAISALTGLGADKISISKGK